MKIDNNKVNKLKTDQAGSWPPTKQNKMTPIINGIELKGIVFTSKIFNRLKDYQLSENNGVDNGVDRDRRIIHNAICYLASLYPTMEEEEYQKTMEVMYELNCVQENLMDFHYAYNGIGDDNEIVRILETYKSNENNHL